MPSAKKLITVVGARPQFVKAGPVSLALQHAGFEEVLVNTGQHYDANMCDVFFEQLNLRPPAYHLGIGSGSHAYQTGTGLMRLEEVLMQERPDAVLVYGDTNATVAAALAAVKLHLPVAHVEAGLRSFNRRMPEEINRVVTDHVAQWLFAPTQTAVAHLAREGITRQVHLSGDVMLDASQLYLDVARAQCEDLLQRLEIRPRQYDLLTMHRAETTAQPEQTEALLRALDHLDRPVVFPVHPRIRPLVERLHATSAFQQLRLIEPVSYFEMLLLEESAHCILTDSGGVQKEAAFFDVPCITLREETEWVETVEHGWNQLTGLSVDRLQQALQHIQRPSTSLREFFGNGQASQRIAQVLRHSLDGVRTEPTDR